MGTLYLVRHGQASFGHANYDVLSPLGRLQAQRLGEHFKAQGLAFQATYSGTLQRQTDTLAGITGAMGQAPAAVQLPSLNEYDSHALIAAMRSALTPLPAPSPASPTDGSASLASSLRDASSPQAAAHFRLLRQALLQWMQGEIAPVGMPSYAAFAGGVQSVLDHVRSHHDGDVLLVSSGGPIATAVGQVLGTPLASTVALNMRIRNTSVTEFTFNPKRHTLLSYNHLPHLQQAEHASWITYA